MMNKKPQQRKSPRLPEYDYSTPAYYFVTICVKDHEEMLGSIHDGKMHQNKFGEIVDKVWKGLPNYYTNVELDYHCTMPNHFHGIIILNSVGEGSPLPYVPTLDKIIGYFKFNSAKQINQLRHNPGTKIWQRSFYDRVIRNEKELYNIRKYIEQNPMKWEYERNCPENIDI
ncbi:MAG: transposase [Bacteroidetes bacterium]|nr:transposase [Bacteroidota bacterium]